MAEAAQYIRRRMPKVLILTAVTMEAAALRRAGLQATVIGIGASRLSAVAVPAGTTHVVMAGVGGAVDPGLSVGDVVVDGDVRDVRRGTVHTVDDLLSTAAEKAAVFAETAAAVVDMEQAVVRRWTDLPVIGVRAVSDAARDAVDPAVLRFVTDVGRPRPLVIAAALLRRPGLVRQLVRLNADTRVALGRLAAVLPVIVRQIEERNSPQMGHG